MVLNVDAGSEAPSVACPPGGVACLNFDGVAACADEQDEPLYAYPVMVQYNPVDTNASATLTLVHNAGGIEETQTNIELLATPPVALITRVSIKFAQSVMRVR